MKSRNENNARLINIIDARKKDIKRMQEKGVSPAFVDEKIQDLEALMDYAAGMDQLVEKCTALLNINNLIAKADRFIIQELLESDKRMSEIMHEKGIQASQA